MRIAATTRVANVDDYEVAVHVTVWTRRHLPSGAALDLIQDQHTFPTVATAHGWLAS